MLVQEEGCGSKKLKRRVWLKEVKKKGVAQRSTLVKKEGHGGQAKQGSTFLLLEDSDNQSNLPPVSVTGWISQESHYSPVAN